MAQASSSRPVCWGNPSAYDNEDRECKGCGFQNSCKEQIIKLNVSAGRVALPQANPTAEYYQRYSPPPYVQPAPVPVAQATVQAPVRYLPPGPAQQAFLPRPATQAPIGTPVTVQVLKPMQQQAAPQQPMYISLPSNYGQFGWYQDPVPSIMAANPAPFRPQMQGEGFAERLLKNALLGMLEVGLVVALQGVRQYVWAPKPTNPPIGPVVQVS